jgi:GH15 family glucan-1,4-alpha-glucosidase
VECLAHGGELVAATASFERLLTYANDVGLFAEEIDPVSGGALGNYPQAFTHVGLINAALILVERGGEGAFGVQARSGAEAGTEGER